MKNCLINKFDKVKHMCSVKNYAKNVIVLNILVKKKGFQRNETNAIKYKAKIKYVQKLRIVDKEGGKVL